MLIDIIPTSAWNTLYSQCRQSPSPVRATRHLFLRAQLGWAIDLVSVEPHGTRELGILFPERWAGHTREDVLKAVDDGSLDASVLNHDALLDGEDTVLVYFESFDDESDFTRSQDTVGPIAQGLSLSCAS